MVARTHGVREVAGSIPVSPTQCEIEFFMSNNPETNSYIDPIFRDKVLSEVIRYSLQHSDHPLSLEEFAQCDPQYNPDYKHAFEQLQLSATASLANDSL